ncbi:hypothetical protein LGT39_05450 [Demequina sp. TTPB684]|uniref:hypothetical protein n=1 Tax=unclassified Demequina TaxID=2620311 RepID=UPI001CF2A59E|nr:MULTISPECIES: hypothetical protein [unclassified Demequina]MCB2412292.1 hypothetical protein [Demequina sp. TTPB684]UPU87572.1 hypothetical protein LGT36_009920 [Demequina sp. TMPB413]
MACPDFARQRSAGGRLAPPYEVSRWLGLASLASLASLATADAAYAHPYPSNYASHVEKFDGSVAEGR